MTDILLSYALTFGVTCLAGALLWGMEALFPGRIPAALRKVLWFLLLARLAVPFGLTDPRSILIPEAGPVQPQAFKLPSSGLQAIPLTDLPTGAASGGLGPLTYIAPADVLPASAPSSDFPWLFYGSAVLYLTGLGLLAGFRVRAGRKLACLMAEETPGSMAEEALKAGVRERWKLPRPLFLKMIPGLDSPALTGLLRPVILLPEGWDRLYSPQEQELMLDHEASHIQAGDVWWILASDVMTLILWFLPAAWIFRSRMVAALEEACDRRVLVRRKEVSPRDYGLTLLKVLSAASVFGAPVPAMASPRKLVKDRIRLIASPRPASFLLTGLILAGLLGACTLGVRVKPELPEQESPNPSLPGLEVLKPEEAVPSNTIISPHLSGVAKTSQDKVLPVAAKPESETWTWPLKGMRGTVTSYYGIAQHPFTEVWYFHKGLDIAAPVGTPLVAPLDGHISGMGYDANGYGLYLEMTHPGEYSTRLAHLSKILPSPGGTEIPRGQTVAFVGSTGYSTGPHVHFEVLKPSKHFAGGGELLDPAPLLGLESKKNPTFDHKSSEEIESTAATTAGAVDQIAESPTGLTFPAVPSQPMESGVQSITLPAGGTLVLPAEAAFTRVYRSQTTGLWNLEFTSGSGSAGVVFEYAGFRKVPWILPGTNFHRGATLPSGLETALEGIQFRIRLGSKKGEPGWVYADLSQAFD